MFNKNTHYMTKQVTSLCICDQKEPVATKVKSDVMKSLDFKALRNMLGE